MKKILSYCLFEPKVLPIHRTHDEWRSNSLRYWFNVPAVVMTNAILYPEYETRLYLSSNIWSHKLSPILEILRGIDNFKIETIDLDYKITEPAIWRMMPLWGREIEVFHTRDIDSVPTEIEYKFAKFFEKSPCSAGTLRTHANHYGIKCRMLAGLSSFKPQKIPPTIKMNDFQLYTSYGHGKYGSDQDLMIKLFTSNPFYTKENFLDCHAYQQKNQQDFPCIVADKKSMKNLEISDLKQQLFECLRDCGLDDWAGKPIDARGRYTNFLLSMQDFYEIDFKIKEDNKLKEFYLL
jgi:hypothetical protein